MNFHHKINKAPTLTGDRHIFRVDSTLEIDGKIFREVSFGRAGLPEYVLKSFMKLADLNEKFLIDKIRRYNLRQFERINHPQMEPILDIMV